MILIRYNSLGNVTKLQKNVFVTFFPLFYLILNDRVNMKVTETNGYNGHITIDEFINNGKVLANRHKLSNEEKIRLITRNFKEIMTVLGLNLDDDSLKDTPQRIAKMYVNEIFSGLNAETEPSIALFENKYGYKEILLEKNIPVYSTCEHHFVPIIGKVHVAYISAGKVIGLSKLNRVVHYFSKRPQVQERLTVEIAEYLKKVLNTEDVAVIMNAEHLCVAMRGVKDEGASTVTSSLHGRFLQETKRNELYQLLKG